MTEYAVELADGPRTSYGQIHVAGCRDLRDPELAGSDPLAAYAEIWPENEPYTEAEFLSAKFKNAAPCAKAAYKADKAAGLL
jgi:hypothetical protein